MNRGILLAYTLLTTLTFAYCIMIWYASQLWSTLISLPKSSDIPFAWLGIAPLPVGSVWLGAIHWQLLALASLIWALYLATDNIGSSKSEHGRLFPLVVHLSWILLALLLHIIGALSPLLTIGYQIG